METLTWREVDLGGVALAGIAAGYVMALTGLWAGRVPGLIAIDIADYGRRYMVSDRPSAWLFGLASHLANSVLLVLLWAMVVEASLEWRTARAHDAPQRAGRSGRLKQTGHGKTSLGDRCPVGWCSYRSSWSWWCHCSPSPRAGPMLDRARRRGASSSSPDACVSR